MYFINSNNQALNTTFNLTILLVLQLVNIRMKEIHGRFAIRAFRVVSPRNPIWQLANRNKPAEGDLKRLFARVKQINNIDDDKY